MNQPPTACRTPGCGGYAVKSGLCADCQPVVATPSGKPQVFQTSKHDYHREWRHLYQNIRWKKLRAAILRRDIICTVCLRRPSTVADHIKDHRGNLQLFYDANNLHGSCKPCHDERTGREHGKGDREPPKQGLDSNGRVIDHYGK